MDGVVGTGLGDELRIEGGDPAVQPLPFFAQIPKQLADAGTQAPCLIGQDDRQFLIPACAVPAPR